MARYIAWQDVVERYADAAKLSGGSEATKTSFVNFAEDETDGRLAGKYQTPFSPVPNVVKDLCIDLAYYKMIFRQEDKAKPVLAYVNTRFADILTGRITLTISGTPLATVLDRAWSTEQGFESSFGVDPPERWAVDSNWQDDFASRRGFPWP